MKNRGTKLIDINNTLSVTMLHLNRLNTQLKGSDWKNEFLKDQALCCLQVTI